MLQIHAFISHKVNNCTFSFILLPQGKLQERNGNQIEAAVEPRANAATGTQ